MKTINLFFFIIIVILIESCGPSKPSISNAGLKSDCPYQRFNFIGTAKTESTRGIDVLNKFSIALELEKNEILKTGKANDSLKIQVSNILKEEGDFEIPVSKESKTEYTELANSICTLRTDLYSQKSIFTPEQRVKAADEYLALLTSVNNLKKKLE